MCVVEQAVDRHREHGCTLARGGHWAPCRCGCGAEDWCTEHLIVSVKGAEHLVGRPEVLSRAGREEVLVATPCYHRWVEEGEG